MAPVIGNFLTSCASMVANTGREREKERKRERERERELDTYVITGVWAGIAQGEGKLCSFYTYYLELWAVVSLFNCTFLNWTRQINH